MSEMRILVLLPKPVGACALYILIYPYGQLHNKYNQNIVQFQVNRGDVLEAKEITDIDVVVIHNQDAELPIIKYYQNLGKKVIVDIDDYFVLPKYHMLHRHFKTSATVDRIRQADLVTTTRPELKEKILKHNPNCEIVLNYIPENTKVIKDVRFPTFDKLRIGYTGGLCHIQDIKTVFGLNKLLYEALGDRYEFYVAGDNGSIEFQKYIYVLSNKGKCAKNMFIHKAVYLDKFYHLYSMFNLSLCPLRDDEFNKCKSNLKFIEAGLFNIPIATNNINTYGELNHNNGIYFKDKYDLVEQLSKINMKDIENMGKVAHEDILNIGIEYNKSLENLIEVINKLK